MLDEVALSAALLAARPATPMLREPKRDIVSFLQGALGFARRSVSCGAASRRRCGVQKNQLATAAMSAIPTSMLPITSSGVPLDMSIWPTRPALATLASIALPALSLALTVSL